MKVAERVAERAYRDCCDDCNCEEDKARALKVLQAAQRSYEAACAEQQKAEVERARLQRAFETMDTYTATGLQAPTYGVAHRGDGYNPGEIIEELLECEGPLTKHQIVEKLHGVVAQRTIDSEISKLRRQGIIMGASLPFSPPVWACVERGIELDEIPGYTKAAAVIDQVHDLYKLGYKRSQIGALLNLTAEEISRLKYKGGVAVLWYR